MLYNVTYNTCNNICQDVVNIVSLSNSHAGKEIVSNYLKYDPVHCVVGYNHH
jgi:hypothetical protein